MASLNSARLRAGSSRWLSPSWVRKLQAIPPTVTVSPRPPAGSQPSDTANVKISTRPTQKVGTEKPRIDSPMMSFESIPCGL